MQNIYLHILAYRFLKERINAKLVYLEINSNHVVFCSMKTNRAQDNGMNIVGEKDEDKNKTGGIENNNASFLIKREQHIPDNASKSQDLQTDKIGETVLTVLPSVLGVLMTGIIFSILMLIFLVKKQRNKILLPENANLL